VRVIKGDFRVVAHESCAGLGPRHCYRSRSGFGVVSCGICGLCAIIPRAGSRVFPDTIARSGSAFGGRERDSASRAEQRWQPPSAGSMLQLGNQEAKPSMGRACDDA
jgi:hypothetical protein